MIKKRKSNKGYNSVTQKSNKGYNSVTNARFSKKTLFQLQPVTNFSLFEIFLQAYNLDLDNLDTALPKADKILKKLSDITTILKYTKARFGVLFILREMSFYSFEQLKLKLGLNQKTLNEVLEELKNMGYIKRESLLNHDVQKFNEILCYAGETKKRSIYSLEWDNPDIKNKIGVIDSFLDLRLIKTIKEEKKYYNQISQEYSVVQDNKKTREKYNKTQLDKIREALIPLINQEKKPKAILDYLHYGKGLISKRSWKGRQDKHGIYSGGWEDYLLEQGFLRLINENDKPLLIVTEKVIKKEIPTKEIECADQEQIDEGLKYLDQLK